MIYNPKLDYSIYKENVMNKLSIYDWMNEIVGPMLGIKTTTFEIPNSKHEWVDDLNHIPFPDARQIFFGGMKSENNAILIRVKHELPYSEIWQILDAIIAKELNSEANIVTIYYLSYDNYGTITARWQMF